MSMKRGPRLNVPAAEVAEVAVIAEIVAAGVVAAGGATAISLQYPGKI